MADTGIPQQYWLAIAQGQAGTGNVRVCHKLMLDVHWSGICFIPFGLCAWRLFALIPERRIRLR